jgi:hypothetical protein
MLLGPGHVGPPGVSACENKGAQDRSGDQPGWLSRLCVR